MTTHLELHDAAGIPAGCPVSHGVAVSNFSHNEALDETVVWNIYDELFEAEVPVHYSTEHGGFWVVTGYDEAKQVLRDFKNFTTAQGVKIPVGGSDRRVPIEYDPPEPEHAIFRSLIVQPVTPERVRELQPELDAIMAELLDRFFANGGGDFVAEISRPMPLMVLARVAGFGDETLEALEPAMHAAYGKFAQPLTLDEIFSEVHQLMYAELEKRRSEPQDDYIGALMAADVNGRPITDKEIVRLLAALAEAGHETTKAASASIAWLLASEPERQRTIREDPTTIQPMIEEMLRLRPPGHTTVRTAVNDVQLGPATIAAGDKVLIVMASANRDAGQFSCPMDLDIDRGTRGHLTFGWGRHQCGGAFLARAELRTLLQMLTTYPTFHLVDVDHGALAGGTMYSPTSVHVAFDAD